MSEKSGPQASEGYTTFEEIERDHTEIRLKDVTVAGKRFELRSHTAEDCQQLLSGPQKTLNERTIVRTCNKPKMTIEMVKRLSKLDGAFIAALANECFLHVGMASLSEVENETKN